MFQLADGCDAMGSADSCSWHPTRPRTRDPLVTRSRRRTRRHPVSARRSPCRHSTVVVLPAPFRPRIPRIPRISPRFRDERYVKEDAYCPSLAIPAVGPDSALYLPLQAATSSVGSSLVGVGPNGKVRPGWPVELQRRAIAPDSTVRWTTTIIEP